MEPGAPGTEPTQEMQPTTTAGTPPADVATPESEAGSERSASSSGRWFRASIDRLRGRSTGPAPAPAEDQPGGQEAPGGQPADTRQRAAQWAPPTNPEEERRRYQSLRDRERADEQRRAYQQQQQERATHIAALEARKTELLRSGAQTWEIGEEIAELEGQILAVREGVQQEDREGGLIGTVTSFYDQLYADGYLAELPVPKRREILAREWHGIEGRQQLAAAIREALKAQWIAEGEQRAEKRWQSSQSKRKQVFHEFGLRADEPDAVPAANGGGPAVTPDMNVWMRRAAGRF